MFCVFAFVWFEGVIDVSGKHKRVDFKCLCVCLKDLLGDFRVSVFV